MAALPTPKSGFGRVAIPGDRLLTEVFVKGALKKPLTLRAVCSKSTPVFLAEGFPFFFILHHSIRA
jgi:hypothetical protein